MSSELPKRYNNLAIILHWGLAILIIGLLVLGYFLPSLPKTPIRKVLFNYHKSLGLIVFGLVIFRIYWRLLTRAPAHLAGLDYQVKLAKYAHILIYILIALVPAIGLTASSFDHGFDLFPYHWDPIFPIDKDLAHGLMKAHGVVAYTLAGFLVLHLAAVAWHQLIKKDGVLHRMWFT